MQKVNLPSLYIIWFLGGPLPETTCRPVLGARRACAREEESLGVNIDELKYSINASKSAVNCKYTSSHDETLAQKPHFLLPKTL